MPGGAGTRPGLAARLGAARKVAFAAAAVALFVLALLVLKEGARPLGPLLRGVLRVDDPLSALGFGWLLATVTLSGSPVASASLGLHAAGALDDTGAYMMILGSRLGAAFIVLLLGFAYTAGHGRRHHRGLGVEAGVLSLLVTYAVALPAVPIGLALLRSGTLAGFAPATPPGVMGLLEATFGAVARALAAAVPHPILVLALGMVIVLGAFRLFDLALPDLGRRAGALGQVADRIYRPGVMFAFGLGVTLLTFSVSVSLGLLVPLTVRGLIRRENLIPYIMGANVSTFVDTLLASVVVGGGPAFGLVLAAVVAVTSVSLVVLGVAFSHLEEAVFRVSARVVASRRGLAAFLMVILICPLLLLLL